MKTLLTILILGISIHNIVCPPVNPQPVEQGSEQDDEDTGLHYDRYLREVVMTLEEDPDFRKKLEEANITEIKSGKIAMHLDKVAHHVREKLDEIKRKEVNRLRMLAKERMKAMEGTEVLKYVAMYGGIQKIDESVLHHVDVGNPHSFEMKDLEKLIKKATSDLDELDKQRRQEFKNYEMEKEHERREHLKELPEEDRKKEELKFEEQKKKHADHPKIHHPGSKDQLEEVWEKQDHMEKESFNPKSFFKMHDLDGNGFLDEEEVESLFQKELDQVYDPEAPEDDMEERYEEMSRMREHVLKELDKDNDKLISIKEFMEYTKSDEFEKDEGWDTLENQEIYSEDDLKEYERVLMEEEMKRRQQGAFDSHAQPGVVMPPHHQQGGVQNMQIPLQGAHPNQFPQGAHPNQVPQGAHPNQFQQPPANRDRFAPQAQGQFAQPIHPQEAAALHQQQMLAHQQQQQMMAHHQQQQILAHQQHQEMLAHQQQMMAQQHGGMNIPAQPQHPEQGQGQQHPGQGQPAGQPVQHQQAQAQPAADHHQAQIPQAQIPQEQVHQGQPAQGQGQPVQNQAHQPGPPGGQGQGNPPGGQPVHNQPPAGNQPVQGQPQVQQQPGQGQPPQGQGQPVHQEKPMV